jgi:hypothetical protein
MVDALFGTMICLTSGNKNAMAFPAQMEKLFIYAFPPKRFSLTKPAEED